jgi:hypothetical protein
MKKILLLSIFVLVMTTGIFSQTVYNIQFRTNGTGAAPAGNTYLNVTAAGVLGTVDNATATAAATANNARWTFIPVGNESVENQPGWYYIRNENGYYLVSTGANNLSVSNGLETGEARFQWRLARASATAPGVNAPLPDRYYRLISKTGNVVLYRGAATPSTSATYDVAASTVAITMVGTGMVYNEDQEVIATAAIPTGFTTALGLPALPTSASDVPDFDPSTPGDNLFTPIGFAYTVSPIRLIHDHILSGGFTGDGYYFSRLSPAAELTTTLTNQIQNNQTITVSMWIRAVGTPSAIIKSVLNPAIDSVAVVGRIRVGTGGTATYISIEIPIDPDNNMLGAEDNDRNSIDYWYFYTSPQTQITPATSALALKNDLTDITGGTTIPATLDIDNINVVAATVYHDVFTHHANTAHENPIAHNTDGAPQYVHSNTQIIYTTPRFTRPINAVTNNMTYYRWYVPDGGNNPNLENTDGGLTNLIPPQTGNPAPRMHEKGLIYYAAAGLGAGTDVIGPGQQINITAPGDLYYNYPQYVTCDVSNYTDGTFSITTDWMGNTTWNAGPITEPTLSFRNHFELRPAWEIAMKIDSSLYQNDASDNNNAFEVIKLMAPLGGTAAASYTHLRLSTKFNSTNYYLNDNASAQDVEEQEDLAGVLHASATLQWVRSTNPNSCGNTLPTAGGDVTFLNAPAAAGAARNNSGNYYYPTPAGADNTDRHIIEIVTGGAKTAGNTEYYDVYATAQNGDGATISRKIARFIVTYVSRDVETNNTTTNVKVPFGTGPRVMDTGTGAGFQTHDILDGLVGTRELTRKNFDEPTVWYDMGTVPMPLDETSYGFNDPRHLTGPATNQAVLGTNATGAGSHHSNWVAYYSEYSFPKAIRAGITGAANGGQGAGYGFYANAGVSVMDRTFLNTGGRPIPNNATAPQLPMAAYPDATIGNMLFVDAASFPGTFATLKISENLCPGSELYFSAWVVNLHGNASGYTTTGTIGDEGSGGTAVYRPNLIFILRGADGNEVTRFYTGDIGRGAIHEWHQVAFNFVVPTDFPTNTEGETEFVLEIINNGLGNNGNDFALDDILIRASNPSIIVSRSIGLFCRPDVPGEGDPLQMKIDVNITKLGGLEGGADADEVYFRFQDVKGQAFPSTYGSNIPMYEGLNHDGALPTEGAYGYISTIGLPTVDTPDGQTHIETVGSGAAAERHLIFYQLIPPAIYNPIVDPYDPKAGLGTYIISTAESLASLEHPECIGQQPFTVKYDETEFMAQVVGIPEIVTPERIAVCTNQEITIIASTQDVSPTGDVSLNKDLYAYYDWYFGPVYTYVPTEDEEAIVEYDKYINLIGLRERYIFGSDNNPILPPLKDIDPIPVGSYSVYADLQAYRRLYQYATENGISGTTPVKWPVSVDKQRDLSVPDGSIVFQTNSKDTLSVGGTSIPDTYRFANGEDPYISTLSDLQKLLERMKYYVDEEILTLYSRTYNASFASPSPYFYTVIPIATAWRTDDLTGAPIIGPGGEGHEDPLLRIVTVCPTPSQVRIQSNEWGPEVEFGEIDEEGLPVTDYREIDMDEFDYVYTVRFPEKFSDGSQPENFVVPLLYIDETRLAKVELVQFNGEFVIDPTVPMEGGDPSPVPEETSLDLYRGALIDNVHIGVISGSAGLGKNTLDKTHKVDVTWDRVNESLLSTPTTMFTYWPLTDIRYYDRTTVDPAETFSDYKWLESYPLIYGSHNYYNPDLVLNHDLEREGDPYALGTYTIGSPDAEDVYNPTYEETITGQVGDADGKVRITNNKIGLEIPAAGLAGITARPGTTDVDGTDLMKDGTHFLPGGEYLFRLVCTGRETGWASNGLISGCDGAFYFRLRIVPDTVYWQGDVNTSWHNDENWVDKNGEKAFAPLKETHVIIESGLASYPSLLEVTEDAPLKTFDTEESAFVTDPLPETPFIEYDFNFMPNAATDVYFKDGSELGSPFYLDYDSVKIDLHLDTYRWYGLSAPLRDMYSGDYSFDRTNPITEMRLFNTINPQTNQEAIPAEWTVSFNTTTVRLNAGTGYSMRIGKTRYHVVNDAVGVVLSEGFDLIPDTTLVFPNKKMSFPFYNEITKKPTGTVQNIPNGGRNFSKRFIYEITEGGKSVVPQSDILVTIPIPANVTTKEQLIVVGNPFMSHIDFAEFYRINQAVINPAYQIIDAGGSVSTLSLLDVTGTIDDPITTVPDGSLTVKSISPMQSFFVKTKDGYDGAIRNLYITKAMSTTDAALSKLRASQASNLLRIKVDKDDQVSYAVIALSDRAHNAYLSSEDSRRILGSGLAAAPNVFTITDGAYLDINRLKEMPASLPIGISTTNKGRTQITLSGLDVLSDFPYNFFFKDAYTGLKYPLTKNGDTFIYEFDNTEGNQIGRFYILRESTSTTGMEEFAEQEKIQIYVHQGVIHVLSSNGTELNKVEIFNINGSKIYQKDRIGSTHVEIPVSQSNPVLIVKANAAKTTKTAKVVITH